MKIKGLLLGMLAYAAMVACTNEDIVKNNVNQPEKVKGNLSLVISSTSNSSRAADNEESGVTDPGIEGESTVTDAVIILNRLDENGNLTKEEFGTLRSQIVTSNGLWSLRCQIGTSKLHTLSQKVRT